MGSLQSSVVEVVILTGWDHQENMSKNNDKIRKLFEHK